MGRARSSPLRAAEPWWELLSSPALRDVHLVNRQLPRRWGLSKAKHTDLNEQKGPKNQNPHSSTPHNAPSLSHSRIAQAEYSWTRADELIHPPSSIYLTLSQNGDGKLFMFPEMHGNSGGGGCRPQPCSQAQTQPGGAIPACRAPFISGGQTRQHRMASAGGWWPSCLLTSCISLHKRGVLL